VFIVHSSKFTVKIKIINLQFTATVPLEGLETGKLESSKFKSKLFDRINKDFQDFVFLASRTEARKLNSKFIL
jgi:hypothetical protein